MPHPPIPFAFAPVPPPRPTPGGMMEPASTPLPLQPGPSLQALLARMVSPLGTPPPVQGVQAVPSLSGADALPTPVSGVDLNAIAAQDPAGAEIGSMLGLGPAFRAAGAVGRGVMAIPGVREGVGAIGRQLARPAVTAPLALGGATIAGASDTQAPTKLGPRTTEAQTALDAARKSLSELTTRRTGLQARIDRYDPERVARLSEADIREAQEAVGARVDGKLGPQTRGAIAEYRRRLQAEIQGLGPRETTLRGDVAKAEERRAEAERLDLADTGRQALEESRPSGLSSFASGIGSYLTGMVGGHIGRSLLARGARSRAAATKAEVDATSAQLGQGELPERVSRLNALWTEGRPPTPFSRGTAPPFAMVPSGSPSLHTPSPVAPWSSVTHEVAPGMMGGNVTRQVLPPDQLYRPGVGTLYGPTAATMGIGGAESAASQFLMLPGAQQALREAQTALDSQGPTPENVDRLRQAQSSVAFWTGMQNLGRGVALGALSGELTHPLRAMPRPSMAAAEAERGRLDMLLHPRAQAVPPPAPPPGPPPAPLALPHSSSFQPRARGRFAPGRPVYPPGDPRRTP